MKTRWSPEATADFAGIIRYIRKDNPTASEKIAHTIYDAAVSLKSFPNRGRAGRVENTRELVLSPLPFFVYRGTDNFVEIARVLHGSQRWP